MKRVLSDNLPLFTATQVGLQVGIAAAWVSFAIHSRRYGAQCVLLDASDLLLVAEYHWNVERNVHGRSFYVRAHPRRGTSLSLHRLLLNPPPGMEVDHVNCDGLDNRRCNLRLCTMRENTWNRGRPSTNTTGYLGVTLVRGRRWRAKYGYEGRIQHIGYFDTPEEAHAAYAATVTQVRGQFARTA